MKKKRFNSNFSFADMSHEIRTPLNVILGASESQLANKVLEADTQEAFIKIYDAGRRLLNVINNIFDLSKTETHSPEIPIINHEYMPYGKVLVVDDMETNLYVAKVLLTPYGLDIETATSGYDAIEKVKNGNVYDIIFLDYMMPQLNGIETAKILREMHYKKPIVALTANSLADGANMFLSNGFDGFMSKPIDTYELNSLLNTMIRDKHQSQEIEAARSINHHTDTGLINERVLNSFLKDAQKAVATLEEINVNNCFNFSEEMWNNYIITVHGMKSALANINENELSAAALRLEQAGREKNTEIVSGKTGKFICEIKRVMEHYEKSLKHEDSLQKTTGTIGFLQEKLCAIQQASASLDKKSAKNALNELKEKTWPRETDDALDSIATYLLHSDFNDAAEAASKAAATSVAAFA